MRAGRVITARIRLMAAIGAGVLIAALAIALVMTRGTLAEARAQFETWKMSVAHAEAEARATAQADKIRKEKEDAKAAYVAQGEFDALRERYALLVRAKAAGGAPGRANLSSAADPAALPAESAAGSGVPFGTILIDTADALICAENTAYAQAAHGWAVAIVKDVEP